MKPRSIPVLSLLLFLSLLPGLAEADRIDGFTEPYKTVEIATTEVGIITRLHVGQGDHVTKGQLIATLDDDVQSVLLTIAGKNVELQGRLESARAELELRSQRLEKLLALQHAGHARREEVERAKADLAIAEAQILAAEEEIAVRELEYNKAAIQLARREVRSPLDGVVAMLLKEEGEFVAPTDPHILHVVQLNELLAVFSVPSTIVEQIEVGMTFDVALAGTVVPGTVEQIAPLTDAESDTIRVKLRVVNQEGQFRSGQRCSLVMPDEKPQAQ